jgi:hypothetical protein
VASYLIDVGKQEEVQLTRDDAAKIAHFGARDGGGRDGGRDFSPAGGDRPSDVVDTPASMFQATEGRWGSREVEITEVTLLDAAGTPAHVFQSGDAIEVRLKTRAHRPIDDFVFGVALFNADGVCCYGTNTSIEELLPAAISGDAEIRFRIARLDLIEGTYKIDVAAHKLDGYPYDYHRLLYTFRVKSRTKDVGIYRPEHQWQFTPNIRFQQGSGIRDQGSEMPGSGIRDQETKIRGSRDQG